MRIVFFQDESELLKRACMSRPLGTFFIKWLRDKSPFRDVVSYFLYPQNWIEKNAQLQDPAAFSYAAPDWQVPEPLQDPDTEHIYLLNGRSLLHIDENHLKQTLASFAWDAALIRISPNLNASKETLKLTSRNQVVGFRRFYNATIEPAELPAGWPDIIVFNKTAWTKICGDGQFPLDFQAFMEKVSRRKIMTVALQAGGHVTGFDKSSSFLNSLHEFQHDSLSGNGSAVSSGSKIVGPLFKGKGVTIEPNVTLIGPVLLADGVHVKSGSVIRRSILGENTTVDAGQLVNNRMWLSQEEEDATRDGDDDFSMDSAGGFTGFKEYRRWPFFSYVRLGKRIFDILCSSLVLLLLVPVFPIIMVIVKLTSPGPVFYRARRQGLHGREFDCLKFRTMILRADSIQERLRAVNQVDGPQFKIENDPRISGVGKFLRDTCIDELPQFINVLLGQMSIVGPRPSPENENDSCPVWRDARLSVRPGITGLWQICRTRQSGADFQEWVYYDTQYVRNVSFRKDLWICFKTAHKLIKGFLGQFG